MNDKRGFTLLEVLIAVAILGIGIIGAMQLFPNSLRLSRMAAERTAAAHAANSELGRLRALSDPEDIRAWLSQSNLFNALNAADSAYALYSGWTTSVQRVSDSEETYRVTFNVQMPDGRIETFVTYVTRR